MSLRASVVIPIYNGLNFLGQAINCLLAQSYENIEIVVIDDCSKENTLEFLKNNYSSLLNSKILYHRNDSNKERCFSRNYGVQLSTGNIVIFLDHDDLFKPAYVQEVMVEYVKNPELEFLYSIPSEFIDNHGEIISNITSEIIGEITDIKAFATNARMITSGMSFRKKSFQKIGGFCLDITQREDWEISCRAVLKAKLCAKIVNNNLVQIRRVKSDQSEKPFLNPADPYPINTLKVISIVENSIRDEDDINNGYLKYIYAEAINVTIQFRNYKQALQLIIAKFQKDGDLIYMAYSLIKLSLKFLLVKLNFI
ncbi:MAG: glycosyltransferase family 2 protein [Proteobacteria bacterium]|nr:glycosyltransferase family 2 protein [Pseudomonadota bacterium]